MRLARHFDQRRRQQHRSERNDRAWEVAAEVVQDAAHIDLVNEGRWIGILHRMRKRPGYRFAGAYDHTIDFIVAAGLQ